MAPLGKGFAVRLEQRIVGEPAKGIVASAVAWETSPIDISADAALQAADAQSSGNVSAGTEAEEFLRDILSAGPVPQKEIKDAAEGHGLAWSTIKRAKARLGIQARKDGMEGGWSWSLPKGLILPEEVHLKGMGPFEGDEPLRNGGPPLWADDGLEIPEFLRRY